MRDILQRWQRIWESAFLGGKESSGCGCEGWELVSAAADSACFGDLSLFEQNVLFLHTLLPGAKSTWHTSSFPKLCVLFQEDMISVVISFPSSTILTLAGNLRNFSPKILIILFACCVEDGARGFVNSLFGYEIRNN